VRVVSELSTLEFEGPADVVGGLALACGPSGFVLGRDQHDTLTTLRLFRPRPTRVLLIDQGWLERVLLMRALALGARVVMHTTDERSWEDFGTVVTGRSDRFRVVPPVAPVEAPAEADQPSLFVAERHLLDLPALGPWQTQLTVATWFGDYLAQPLAQADLVILRRLPARQVAAARTLMRLDGWRADALQETPIDGVALCEAGDWQYLRVLNTTVEQELFGPPR
jgi:hypothetical protein